MNKMELAKRMSQRLSLPYKVVVYILDTLNAELAEALREKERLVMKGFGTYSLWKQAGRQGCNPKNGKKYMIAPRISVKFKPGKGLLDQLNEE